MASNFPSAQETAVRMKQFQIDALHITQGRIKSALLVGNRYPMRVEMPDDLSRENMYNLCKELQGAGYGATAWHEDKDIGKCSIWIDVAKQPGESFH